MGRTGDAWSIASAAAECRRLGRLLKTALFRTGHEIRKRGKHENEFWVLLALRFEAASWLCCRLYLQGLGISARPSSSFAPSNGSAAKGLIWRADHAGQGTQFAAPPNSGEFSYRNQKLCCSERVTKSGRKESTKTSFGYLLHSDSERQVCSAAGFISELLRHPRDDRRRSLRRTAAPPRGS